MRNVRILHNFYTLEEVAKKLKINRNTVLKYIKDGRIPVYKLRNMSMLLVDRQDLTDFLRSNVRYNYKNWSYSFSDKIKPNEKILTTIEVAKLLGVSKNTVLNFFRTKKMNFVKISKTQYGVVEQEFLKFVDERVK